MQALERQNLFVMCCGNADAVASTTPDTPERARVA